MLGQGDRNLDGLRLVCRTRDLESREVVELILVGGLAEVHEVSFGRSSFNRPNAKAEFVFTGRKRIDDVLRFEPTGRMLRRQRNELGFVHVGNRQKRTGLRQRIIEITAIARSIFFEGLDTKFGLFFVDKSFLRLARLQEFLGKIMTALEVAVICFADFLVRMKLDFPTLS